jgi:uroporphyrinogen III methyltransferase/synthase
MGVANLPHITSKLIENGRSADTPAAVIRWGTKPEQRTLVTTVGKAAEDVAKNGIKPPAIFIVGEVVKLRDSLQWFDNLSQRPLFGKRILVTRARSQASKLTAKLENLGAEVFEAPAISMADPADNYAALDKSIDHLQDYHWLIFTSANGVGRFFARLFKAGKDARALGYAKIAAIGSATAEKLKQYGIVADVIPGEYRAEGIIEALKGKLPPHAKILIPRAEEAREILPESYSRKAVSETSSHAILLMHALADGDEELLNTACRDIIHEPYRTKLIDGYDTVRTIAETDTGGKTAVSGSGPALLLISKKQLSQEAKMEIASIQEHSWNIIETRIAQEGIAIQGISK